MTKEGNVENIMIYTITLNPSLDYMVTLEEFYVGATNKAKEAYLVAGGKGINVSYMLQNLNIETKAMGFVAGFTGREILRQLEKRGLSGEFIMLKEGESRINIKLRTMEETEINAKGPVISTKDIELLLEKLSCVEKGDIVILSGSLPASEEENLYVRIVQELKTKQVKIIADTAGKVLLDLLPYEPFFIKPNQYELGELFQVSIENAADAISYAKKLQELGAKNVLVSLGAEGAVLVTETRKVFVEKPPTGKLVNSVGAGDSMVAGFVAGWLRKEIYEYAFLMALASGSGSAYAEEFATRKEVEKLYEELKMRRIPYADL